MKTIAYYPGCTLKNTAKNFEDSALCALDRLGYEAKELARWNCCGTVFSLATDDLMHHVAPIRNLVRAKEAGSDTILTLCAMCYNTLKRANERVKNDAESLEKINNFMDTETVKYAGDVRVLHLLEILRDELTFPVLAGKVVKKPNGLKVANYYGCLLVRPKSVGLDDQENPIVLEDLMTALGIESVEFPYKTECCGAYQTVDEPKAVADRTYRILSSARRQGADLVTVSCPLCAFNLDQRQKQAALLFADFEPLPVVYFTQLLALGLGCPEDRMRFDLHYVDPRPVLKKKGVL
ncbi:MAG: CoB--CoM heterodisulfide reductase iron-sulfur subunit B family protein [Candidatus Aminicenantes bacterium]|nr:CoB--CoM heterodisulfide reductase iron-sulfur subunit B family protein [Candidatus Aminicenantes bacterium]